MSKIKAPERKQMARFDGRAIEVTPRFIAALHELLEAELEMMRRADPSDAYLWAWGRCKLGDMCCADALTFEFGADDDRPRGMTANTQVAFETVKPRTSITLEKEIYE